jgi:mycothiol system anti-sigma-R factor
MDDSEAHCRQIIEKVFLYIDGEIPVGDGVQIEAHLDECQDCLDHYGFEVKIKQVLKRGCAEPCPSEIVERLRRFVAELPDP